MIYLPELTLTMNERPGRQDVEAFGCTRWHAGRGSNAVAKGIPSQTHADNIIRLFAEQR
jgi:hypothetical protein